MSNFTRKPWARQWSRWISQMDGSGCINAASTIQVATSGTNYPMSGYDYRFVRADLYFTKTDSRTIKISVSSADMAAYIYNTTTGAQHISVESDNQDWVIKKYDPVVLDIGAASGVAHYKIYTEII